MAWSELNNTGLLLLLDDTNQRQVLAEYYAERTRVETALQTIERRSRSQYFDLLHELGLLDGEIDEDDIRRFRSSSEMEVVLRGLGAHLFSSRQFLDDLRVAAEESLQVLDRP